MSERLFGVRKQTIVNSLGREHGELLPFMEDTRGNFLEKYINYYGSVYIKPVAFPYTEKHLLVIPDAADQHNMPGILDVPSRQLESLFKIAGKLADYAIREKDVRQVDIGWNYSPHEPNKIIASQRNNLHVHVNAMTEEDLAQPVPPLKENPSLRSEVWEPMNRVIAELLEKNVYRAFENQRQFDRYFEKIIDRRRVTFGLKMGLVTFEEPDFIELMKDIHKKIISEYQELGSCFFEQDEKGNFVTRSEDEEDKKDNRYTLLDEDERDIKIEEYIARHPDLSGKTQKTLRFLAENAQQTLEHQDVSEKDNNKSYMVNGPAFSTVFTGIKSEIGETKWRMGIDPVAFSTRDFLQASRGTTILFQRKKGEYFSSDRLEKVKEWERNAVEYVRRTLPLG